MFQRTSMLEAALRTSAGEATLYPLWVRPSSIACTAVCIEGLQWAPLWQCFSSGDTLHFLACQHIAGVCNMRNQCDRRIVLNLSLRPCHEYQMHAYFLC